MTIAKSKNEVIKELKKQLKHKDAEMKQLKKENKELQRLTEKLTRLFTIFCNPHTPPSKQLLKRKKKEGNIPKKRGAPNGHKGATRKIPKPTVKEIHRLEKCPICGGRITKSAKVLRRIIEEIQKPQPVEVIEYLFETGICEPHGNKED